MKTISREELKASEVPSQHGYRHLSHSAGGLLDWEAAGYQLEGESI
jgi:hypothetical protein